MAAQVECCTRADTLSHPEGVGKDGLLEIPPIPEDYRHLDDGYTSFDVAPWAEQRKCVSSGKLRVSPTCPGLVYPIKP